MHELFEVVKLIKENKNNKIIAECPFCKSTAIIPFFGIDNPSGKFITCCCKQHFIVALIELNGIRIPYHIRID